MRRSYKKSLKTAGAAVAHAKPNQIRFSGHT